MKQITAAAFALLLLPFVAGCTDADKLTAPATDRITVAPESNSTALNAGTTATIGISVTRPVGYSGPVTLTAENMPAGVSGVFAPATLTSSQNSSTLTLTADAGAPSGTTSVTVRASGTDLTSQTTTISVVVGSSTPGSFTLNVSPGVVSVNKGGSTSAIVSIDRQGGFSGAVSLTISGFPGGVFASVSPATISAGIGLVNIQLDNTVQAGSYTAIISGDAAGVGSQSTTLTLTVVPALRAN